MESVRVGDTVIFRSYECVPIDNDGKDYFLVEDNKILAILEDI